MYNLSINISDFCMMKIWEENNYKVRHGMKSGLKELARQEGGIKNGTDYMSRMW